MEYLSKRPTFRITSARFELAFPTSWRSFFLSIVKVPVFSIARFMPENSSTIPSTLEREREGQKKLTIYFQFKVPPIGIPFQIVLAIFQ